MGGQQKLRYIIVATYSGSVVRVFVNGVMKGEVNEIDRGDGALGWSHDVFKRRRQGAVSEIFIYDEAMSAAEIKVTVETGLAETLAVRVRSKLPTVCLRCFFLKENLIFKHEYRIFGFSLFLPNLLRSEIYVNALGFSRAVCLDSL